MFKKRFKISNSHPLSNKDRKNLRDQLLKLQYDADSVTHFLNDKNYVDMDEQEDGARLCMDKIQGSKAVLYSRGGIPYLFCPELKQAPILPSIYLLFMLSPTSDAAVQLIPLRIFLKEGVQSFIFNGADLMWPGVRAIEHAKGFEEFDQNQVVVIYAYNGRRARAKQSAEDGQDGAIEEDEDDAEEEG